MEVKKGFTLSEVMIAMTVLGVIAAILIPTIMNTMPSGNNVMFKKAYSSIEKAVSNMINDETNYPSDQTIIPDNGTVRYSKGFNYTASTTNTVSATRYNKFCYLLTDQLNLTTGGGTSCMQASATGTHSFTTTDGIVWTLYIPVADTVNDTETVTTVWTSAVQFPVISSLYTTTLTFDVNSGSKSTNCSQVAYTNPTVNACAAGVKPDTFRVQIRYDGKLMIPSGDTVAQGYLTNPLNNSQ